MLLSCMTVFASKAETGLPFDLVAPGNVTAEWLEERDSPTTTSIVYTLSNEMTEFFSKLDEAKGNDTFAEFMSPYSFNDIGITTQVDWAVDDVNDPVSGWHCNEYWNADYGFGYDEEHRPRTGEWDGVDMWIGNWTETVNSHWVTRGVTEEALNGNPEVGIIGLKDQLRPDQYSYHDDNLWIDMTEHTVFYRMRFVVTTYTDTDEGVVEKFYYSDWSNTASVGKGAAQYTPLTAADLPAPVITDLHMTDKEFNDNPVVAYTLTVPAELMEKAAKAEAHGGGIYIETYARVKGDTEWTFMPNSDWTIRAGEMECALIHLVNGDRSFIPKDTVIELRCRYWCSQPDMDDIFSDYSKIISFGTNDISEGGNGGGVIAPGGDDDKSDCPICHFCPRPLGLCIFIWIAIILAVIIIIVVIIVAASKKKKKDN